MATKWTTPRLSRLFERYRRRYWKSAPARDLARYRVVERQLEDNVLGKCDPMARIITVDISKHGSDRQVRSTLLHEMAHAAAKTLGHSIPFFKQLEELLHQGAPIGVGAPEAGKTRILQDIVPARFPLLKQRMERAEAERQRVIKQSIKRRNIPTVDITDDEIVRRFEEAAQDLPWKDALLGVGHENGLTDEMGRPKNRWAARLVKRGKRAHARARRDHLAYMRAQAAAFNPLHQHTRDHSVPTPETADHRRAPA